MILKNFKTFCTRTYPRRAYVDAKSVKLAYTLYNEGKDPQVFKSPLMIIHGIFGSRQNFKSTCRALEPKIDRKIFALDARNHGESPHTMEMTSKHMALDVLQLMTDLDIQQICAMGHSMGARAMMYLALKHPENVERAIFCDMSPMSLPSDFSETLTVFQIMQEIERTIPKKLDIEDGREFAREKLKAAIKKKSARDFIIQNLRKGGDGSYTWAINVEAFQRNFNSIHKFHEEIAGLKPYMGPVMFICGRRSSFVDPNSWPDIQKIFPNSEIHYLNSGHLVHFEQPIKFVQLIVEFLTK